MSPTLKYCIKLRDMYIKTIPKKKQKVCENNGVFLSPMDEQNSKKASISQHPAIPPIVMRDLNSLTLPNVFSNANLLRLLEQGNDIKKCQRPTNAHTPEDLTKLPINLSTLLPVSKHSLNIDDLDSAVQVKNFNNNFVHSPLNGFQSATKPPKESKSGRRGRGSTCTPPPFTWPGVEAIVNSYQKLSQGMLSN